MALKVADKCRWKTQKRTFIQWSIWSKATRRKNLVTASEDWIQALPGQSQMSQPPGRDPKSNARQRGSFLLSNPVPLPALPPRGIYIDRCIKTAKVCEAIVCLLLAVGDWVQDVIPKYGISKSWAAFRRWSRAGGQSWITTAHVKSAR